MSIIVDITYQSKKWDEKSVQKLIITACEAVIPHFELGKVDVSVVLADNDFVQNLNKQYRGKDKPTNVLSFPARDDMQIIDGDDAIESLGDIIIAFETVVRESTEQEKSFNDHLSHLTIHGMLHLLGLDHILPDEAEEMEELEQEILLSIGITNPYDGTDVIG